MSLDEQRWLRVVQVIETKLTTRGKGTHDDPARRVTQYWTMDGSLLFEDDPHKPPVHCNAVGHKIMKGQTRCMRCAAEFGVAAP